MKTAATDEAADRIVRTIPADRFPADGPPVIFVDVDGQPLWLIREGADLADVVAELDIISTHLVRHGLWAPQRDDEKPPSPRLSHAS